jgi:hypothetical protein
MRTLNTAGQALLARLIAGEQIPIVQLVMAEVSPTQYLCTAGLPVEWNGHTWQPVGLQIEPVTHSAGAEVDNLAFSLPGVQPDQLALALVEPVEGRAVRVYDALVDPATGEVADAVLAWSGTLNVPGLQDGPQAVVSWTAEHRALQALRPKPSRYTNDEQQRLFSGDTCLDYDPATDAAPEPWPAAAFFRK